MAALGAGALVWYACGDDSASTDQQPKRGGVLPVGGIAPYSGLDPHAEAGTGLDITAHIYGYALHVDSRDDSIIYDQAESVEQPDAVTYLLKLRSDVRFQDVAPVNGRALDAEDVALSFLRFRDNPVATTRTFHATVLDSVEVASADVARITTKRPYVYTLSYVGDIASGAIVPKEFTQTGTSMSTVAAGTGPFRLNEASPPGRASVLRHDGYYRTPVPYLDGMDWRVFSDHDALIRALRAREILVASSISAAQAGALRDEGGNIVVGDEPSLSWLAIGLRCDQPPFADTRVREAMDLAIDRDALVTSLPQGEGRVTGPVNPHLADAYWSLPEEDVRASSGGSVSIADRRARARGLVEAAGASGATFDLQVANVPALIEVASVVQQQLLDIGLVARVQPLDLLTWFGNERRGMFAATLISHLPYESPDIPLRFFHSGGPDNALSPFGFSDASIDSLIERSWGETDRLARQATIREAQQRMLEARPMLQLYTTIAHSAAWNDVHNLRPGLPGSLASFNYEQWIEPSE